MSATAPPERDSQNVVAMPYVIAITLRPYSSGELMSAKWPLRGIHRRGADALAVLAAVPRTPESVAKSFAVQSLRWGALLFPTLGCSCFFAPTTTP